MIELKQIQHYIPANKEILEEVINREQNFLKTIPKQTKERKATKEEAVQFA